MMLRQTYDADENAPRSNDFSRYGAVTTKVVTTWLFSEEINE